MSDSNGTKGEKGLSRRSVIQGGAAGLIGRRSFGSSKHARG